MTIEGVVVLFKPEEEMFKNIDSYIDSIDRLYVVDNTPEADISKRFHNNNKIKYIPLKDNKGIAYALNVGAKEAIKNGADWLLTMDQDSTFEKDALKSMIEFIEYYKKHPSIEKIVGTKLNKIGIISPFHKTARNLKDNPTGISMPLEVMTSGNLVNLQIYEKIGGFKDWLFIDCVDFDYCLNLRKQGYEIIQLNYARLDHELGDTHERKILGKTVYIDNHSAFRRYYIARNRKYLYDLYHDDFPVYCEYEIKCTRKELIKLWLFEKNKIKKTKAIMRGLRDYKKGVKGK